MNSIEGSSIFLRNKKNLIVAMALIILMALAGCGGDTPASTQAPTPLQDAPNVGASPSPASADNIAESDHATLLVGMWHNNGQEGHMLEFFADRTLTVHIWEIALPHTWEIEGDTLSIFLNGELSTSNDFSISRDVFTMYTIPPTGVMQQIDFSRLADGYEWGAFVAANAPATHPAQSLLPPGASAQGPSLVGRWRHDADNFIVDFLADGTGVDNQSGRAEEFTWTTSNGVLTIVSIDERDYGEFSVRFQQNLDAQFGAYWTGYWLHFDTSDFGSSSAFGPHRYRQLDGNMGQIYGRWAVDLVNIRDDIASFEILPNGTGNFFPAAGPNRPNPDPAPFTWRIENGRFIRTAILESDIEYSIEGDTLTMFDSGGGWEEVDRFTRQAS